MKAFILAGGFATRLWPLTESRAKPLLPLAGKPMIAYQVEQIPTDIGIAISTNAAFGVAFRRWVRESPRGLMKVYVEQTLTDDNKLGALGALAQWVENENIEDDVLLLTGDNYFGFDFAKFLAQYTPGTPLLAAYDIGSLEAARAFGTVLLEPGTQRITGFEEKPSEPKTTLVSTGCSILPKEVLPLLIDYAEEHPDNVGGIFEELLAKDHNIDCFTFTEPWFDVGSFQAYLDATRALVGDNIHAEEGAQCTRCTTHGTVVLGTNTVAENCILENVVAFEDCVLKDCVLRDCIIDNKSQLTGIELSRQMLREGTVIRR